MQHQRAREGSEGEREGGVDAAQERGEWAAERAMWLLVGRETGRDRGSTAAHTEQCDCDRRAYPPSAWCAFHGARRHGCGELARQASWCHSPGGATCGGSLGSGLVVAGYYWQRQAEAIWAASKVISMDHSFVQLLARATNLHSAAWSRLSGDPNALHHHHEPHCYNHPIQRIARVVFDREHDRGELCRYTARGILRRRLRHARSPRHHDTRLLLAAVFEHCHSVL